MDVLAGIKVIDLTRVIAGPLAGQNLGDLGADVIKIERPGGGDDVRGVGPPWLRDKDGQETHLSTYFQAVNRNKRSVCLDFTQPEGAEILRKLASQADVLVENFRPGTLAKYGLGYDALRAVNPRLVYCSLTGFGQTGPYSERSGYDFVMQAMGGLMDVTGPADGEPGAGPVRVGIPVIDIFAGMNATIAILAALRHRDQSGQGQYIDISLFDSQLAAMLNPFVAWFNGHDAIPRTGNHHPSSTPYGVFPTADGFILIASFSDREFVRVARALGRPEWAADPRFALSKNRAANRRLLIEEISEVLRGGTRAEWVARLEAEKISCGPINRMADLETDPQVAARDTVVRMPHPVNGELKLCASPLRLSESPVSYRRAPPAAPGQDTDDVLGEMLGIDAAKRAELRERGIV
jgi:crotonobetainyl-CoA:carnitine CoA-transferase CaiB-like acyl-CoA transferase